MTEYPLDEHIMPYNPAKDGEVGIALGLEQISSGPIRYKIISHDSRLYHPPGNIVLEGRTMLQSELLPMLRSNQGEFARMMIERSPGNKDMLSIYMIK